MMYSIDEKRAEIPLGMGVINSTDGIHSHQGGGIPKLHCIAMSKRGFVSYSI